MNDYEDVDEYFIKRPATDWHEVSFEQFVNLKKHRHAIEGRLRKSGRLSYGEELVFVEEFGQEETVCIFGELEKIVAEEEAQAKRKQEAAEKKLKQQKKLKEERLRKKELEKLRNLKEKYEESEE
jgi:hypothetical protein